MSTQNNSLVNIMVPPGAMTVPGTQAAPTKLAAKPADVAPRKSLDIDALRARLATQRGPYLWRSLEQVAETPEFQDWADHEFAAGADDQAGSWRDPLSRRRLV